MKVLSWNTLFAGIDRDGDFRRKFQIEVIKDIKPDIFLMQEAKGFEQNAHRLLFETEAAINMRGFLGRAVHTGQNTAIFINPAFQVLSFDFDNIHFHHAATFLTAQIPGFLLPVQFASIHLCPNGPEVRRREASYLSHLANPESLSLITGDFNSLSAHDPEPENWGKLALHDRSRYFEGLAFKADRSVIEKFEASGFIDCGLEFGSSAITTVPTKAYIDSEFVPFRCDFAMASKKLAVSIQDYKVIKNAKTDMASDHYPVLIEFASV